MDTSSQIFSEKKSSAWLCLPAGRDHPMAWTLYVVWKALVNSPQLRWQLGNLATGPWGKNPLSDISPVVGK